MLFQKTYIWSSHPYLKEAFLILNRFKSLTLSTNPDTHFWSIPGSLLYQAHSQQYTLQRHCLHLDTPISFQVLYLHSLQSGFSQVMNSLPTPPSHNSLYALDLPSSVILFVFFYPIQSVYILAAYTQWLFLNSCYQFMIIHFKFSSSPQTIREQGPYMPIWSQLCHTQYILKENIKIIICYCLFLNIILHAY